jgi:hypothetical protein
MRDREEKAARRTRCTRARHEEATLVSSGQTAAGVTAPDTKLARNATELVRDSTSDLVYNHSRRVFWFGSLRPRARVREHAVRWLALYGVWQRIRLMPRADSSDFARNPAAGLSAISSV